VVGSVGVSRCLYSYCILIHLNPVATIWKLFCVFFIGTSGTKLMKYVLLILKKIIIAIAGYMAAY